MQLGITLMDNNQALFSPFPSRPGKLRDETKKPGVGERGTRSGLALWNSPPPWRYDGDSLSGPFSAPGKAEFPVGLPLEFVRASITAVCNEFGFCFFKRHWVHIFLGPFFIILSGSSDALRSWKRG